MTVPPTTKAPCLKKKRKSKKKKRTPMSPPPPSFCAQWHANDSPVGAELGPRRRGCGLVLFFIKKKKSVEGLPRESRAFAAASSSFPRPLSRFRTWGRRVSGVGLHLLRAARGCCGHAASLPRPS